MATQRQIELAFLNSIRSINDGVQYSSLRDAIRRGDYQAVLAAVDVEDAAFDPLRLALTETYAEGGVNAITGQRWPVPVRWNSATPQAEYYARTVVGGHITVITNDMRDAVRWTVGDGLAFGRSKDRIALDIAGRIGASGRREGGMIGLNRPQAEWVASMRRSLETDPATAMRFKGWDRRFNKLVNSGNPLTADQIDRITGVYTNKLLLSRGRTIARTERGLAINMGRMEGWRQALVKTGIPDRAVIKEWWHTGRSMIDRVTHQAANGQKVRGLNALFNVGGVFMTCPHDPAAPVGEVVNCECQVKIALDKNWRQYG